MFCEHGFEFVCGVYVQLSDCVFLVFMMLSRKFCGCNVGESCSPDWCFVVLLDDWILMLLFSFEEGVNEMFLGSSSS